MSAIPVEVQAALDALEERVRALEPPTFALWVAEAARPVDDD